jgi:hypothetical protein
MTTRIAFLVAFLAAGTATAQSAPRPGEVRIAEISHSGDGCVAGTVADMVSPDGKAFTLFFSDFGVTSERQGVTRKSCNIRLKINAPQEYEFSLLGLDYRGYMDITNKAMLKFSTRANAGHGNGGQKIFDIKFKGPKADEFYFPVRVGDQSKWSGCASTSRTVGIVTEVALQTANGSGSLVTIDSMDGEFAQQYSILWRRCR